ALQRVDLERTRLRREDLSHDIDHHNACRAGDATCWRLAWLEMVAPRPNDASDGTVWRIAVVASFRDWPLRTLLQRRSHGRRRRDDHGRFLRNLARAFWSSAPGAHPRSGATAHGAGFSDWAVALR